VDYSIIIPVFNKAELTRNCLKKLRPSLDGAGIGEVIVIDNASTDHTPEVLAGFPWIRHIRNEENLGFSGANNQGAREANGKYLVLLNNDTEPISQWLAPMLQVLQEPDVGAVGARLLFADRTIQHAGVAVRSAFVGAPSFIPYHYLWKAAGTMPAAAYRREFQVVTGACLATPRELYLELGGLDEGYWNGYEDVDYCFKLKQRGFRIIYEPQATLFHYESQSGSQRFRKTMANVQRLSERWKHFVDHDAPRIYAQDGVMVSVFRNKDGVATNVTPTAPIDVIVHGELDAAARPALRAALDQNRSPIGNVVWTHGRDAVDRARAAMELRGGRVLLLLRSDTILEPGWLDELLGRLEIHPNACAATFDDRADNAGQTGLLTSDARCVLLRLRQFPQLLALGDADDLDAAVVDLLLRANDLNRITLGVRPKAQFGPTRHADLITDDVSAIEARVRARTQRERGLVSIVTLSWNAPDYTMKALESIAMHTSEPYEVIVVDNGSGPDTLKKLAEIDDPHVRIVYNKTNRGFAGGNNDGIAVARGDYIIVLNNDVVVTAGWVDGLVDAFRRIPDLGISAPRSNYVAGDQQLPEVKYADEEAMFAFADERRAAFARSGYITDRAIGFCWCIDRRIIDLVGGLDEAYGAGNFEDDDYCLRVRAAGYSIYVCNDVFIHHFGSRTFAANKLDWRATMDTNWGIFAKKWGFSGPIPERGYNPAPIHGRGFERSKHFVPLPKPPKISAPAPVGASYSVTFATAVRSEADWSQVAQFVRRFGQAFGTADPVRLLIAAFGEPHAHTIAARVERIFEKTGLTADDAALVEIVDYESEAERDAEREGHGWIEVGEIVDRSPSALRRMLEKQRV
jgi:GT2 family glycosyltransferase